MEEKYYRASVTCEDGTKRTLDLTGYTSMNKAKKDIRANGYKVSTIVEIKDEMEMQIPALENGSYLW